MPYEIVDALIGVYLPPLSVYQYKGGITSEFWIDLVCCLFYPLAIFYNFYLRGIDPLVAYFLVFLSPVGFFLGTKRTDIFLVYAVLAWIFGFGFGGMAFSSFHVINHTEGAGNK